MSFLIAIEGADGAGKHTTSHSLADLLRTNGKRAEVVSFPRYQETTGGYALGEFLSGRIPTTVTPTAAAVLYALDRLESVEEIARLSSQNDFIIFDRYIASNIAYQSAKVHSKDQDHMISWITDLETTKFGIPLPNLSVFLDTSIEVSRNLIELKAVRDYTDRKFDEHEIDQTLQQNVRLNYRKMVEEGVLGPWIRVETDQGGKMRSKEDITVDVLNGLMTFA